MNKKFFFSLISLFIIVAAALLGTFSYFTATKTIEEASFIVGTIDLDVKSGIVPLESFIIENLGDDYNMSGEKEWAIRNTGTLPGRLILRLNNIENINGGCNDQKRRERPNCDKEDFGLLGDYINLTIKMDNTDLATSTLRNEDIGVIRDKWNLLDPIILQPSEEKKIKVSWFADPNEYGNEIQADEVRFDIVFRLIQRLENTISSDSDY